MFTEAIVVLARNHPHFRVTRALRPLFVLDSNLLVGVRRYVCIVYVLCVFLYDPDYMPYYFGWFAFLASVLYYDNRMSKKINLYRNYAENNLQDRTVSLQPSFLVHLIFFV